MTPELCPAPHAVARRIAVLAYAENHDDFLAMAEVLVTHPDDRPLEHAEQRIRECVFRFGTQGIEVTFRVFKERPWQPTVLPVPVRGDRMSSAEAVSLPLAKILTLRTVGGPEGHATKPPGRAPMNRTPRAGRSTAAPVTHGRRRFPTTRVDAHRAASGTEAFVNGSERRLEAYARISRPCLPVPVLVPKRLTVGPTIRPLAPWCDSQFGGPCAWRNRMALS
jgi:hypothetical protein